jgi:hypothetical protein
VGDHGFQTSAAKKTVWCSVTGATNSIALIGLSDAKSPVGTILTIQARLEDRNALFVQR